VSKKSHELNSQGSLLKSFWGPGLTQSDNGLLAPEQAAVALDHICEAKTDRFACGDLREGSISSTFKQAMSN